MSQSVVLTGMVLSAMPVGDFDKRITILTKERGKIHSLCKGRKTSKQSAYGRKQSIFVR